MPLAQELAYPTENDAQAQTDDLPLVANGWSRLQGKGGPSGNNNARSPQYMKSALALVFAEDLQKLIDNPTGGFIASLGSIVLHTQDSGLFEPCGLFCVLFVSVGVI